MDEKIEITIKHVTDESDGFAHKLLYVERQINRDGEVVYSDRISPEIMLSSTDPLSEFHNWLYNTGRYRSKVRTGRKYSLYRRLVSFFQLLPLRIKIFALRLKMFHLQKKVLLIKSFRFSS